jgi:hypothetical protein
MKRIENADGTITSIFQYTDRSGVKLRWKGKPSDEWTLIFYDDGDPVVFDHVPRWQLEHLKEAVDHELQRSTGQ